MTHQRPLALALLALVLGAAAPLPAVAGDGAAGAAEAASGAVGSDEIDAFARATLSMAELREEFIDRIAAAGSEAEQQALVEEGNAALTAAIEDEPGISLTRYIEISEAAQTDAALSARILETLETLAPES
jgi:hypothetical protein